MSNDDGENKDKDGFGEEMAYIPIHSDMKQISIMKGLSEND